MLALFSAMAAAGDHWRIEGSGKTARVDLSYWESEPRAELTERRAMAPEPIASTPASYRVIAADRRQSTAC